MTVGQSRDHLAKDAHSFLLGKTAIVDDIMEQFTAFYVLEYQIPRRLSIELRKNPEVISHSQFTSVLPDIIETDDMGMFNQFHNHNFSFDAARNLAFLLLLC